MSRNVFLRYIFYFFKFSDLPVKRDSLTLLSCRHPICSRCWLNIVLLDEDHRIYEQLIPQTPLYGETPLQGQTQTRDFVLDSADLMPDLDSFFQVFSSPIVQLIASAKPLPTSTRASDATATGSAFSTPTKAENERGLNKRRNDSLEREAESESMRRGEENEEDSELDDLVIPNSILFRCPACQVTFLLYISLYISKFWNFSFLVFSIRINDEFYSQYSDLSGQKLQKRYFSPNTD
jgi:hypothetical protein